MVDNRWTKNIDDIVEIIDGEVPPEKASEIYKKFLKTVY
jgi:hypothetical protein